MLFVVCILFNILKAKAFWKNNIFLYVCDQPSSNLPLSSDIWIADTNSAAYVHLVQLYIQVNKLSNCNRRGWILSAKEDGHKVLLLLFCKPLGQSSKLSLNFGSCRQHYNNFALNFLLSLATNDRKLHLPFMLQKHEISNKKSIKCISKRSKQTFQITINQSISNKRIKIHGNMWPDGGKDFTQHSHNMYIYTHLLLCLFFSPKITYISFTLFWRLPDNVTHISICIWNVVVCEWPFHYIY